MKKQSGGIFRLFLFPFWLCSQTSFFSPITCENNIFVFIHKAFIKDIPPHRASERERTNDVGSDDARNAEKADRGERFFVGCDREVRRYLFHTHSSEIEWDRYQILVRGEYGDEKVD